MNYEVKTKRMAALEAAIQDHMTDCYGFVLSAQSKLQSQEWIDAAAQAYMNAGGMDAYVAGVKTQATLAPLREQDPMYEYARRMGTAQYIRDGGLAAQEAAAAAYVQAAASAADRRENRSWRKTRRQANRSLLRVVRHFNAMCGETSWAEAVDFTHRVYMSESRISKTALAMGQGSWSEFFTAMGVSEAVRDRINEMAEPWMDRMDKFRGTVNKEG